MEHAKSYGGWGGAPGDRQIEHGAPRASRPASGTGSSARARRKHDPDADGKPTTCGRHSEAHKDARRAKQDAKWTADRIRGILNADIAAVGRVLELVDRRGLQISGWGNARFVLDAILTELRDA